MQTPTNDRVNDRDRVFTGVRRLVRRRLRLYWNPVAILGEPNVVAAVNLTHYLSEETAQYDDIHSTTHAFHYRMTQINCKAVTQN